MMFTISRSFILFCLLSILISNTNAVTVNYSVEGGVYRSDNIERTEFNQIKDTVAILGVGLEVVGQSRNNDIALLMDLERREYKEKTYTDDTRSMVDLKSVWGIIDRTLTWTVDGFYGQARIDPFAVITPANLQNVGYYSTGPNLNMFLTAVDRLNLSAHYNGYYAEIDNTDNTSGAYSISYVRSINASTSISANTNYNVVDYDDPVNVDFNRFDYFLNFTRTTTVSDLIITYGKSDLEFDTGQTLDGDYKRLSFLWRLNRANTVQLGLADEINDGAQNLTGGAVSGAIAAGTLFRNQQGSLSYQYVKEPVELILFYRYADEDYLVQNDFDRKVRSGNASVVFGQDQDLQLSLSYLYNDFDYYVRGQEDTETTTAIRLSKSISTNVSFGLEGQRFNRESTTQTQDIIDNQFLIFIRYQSRNR